MTTQSEDKQLMDLVNDINEQRAANEDKSMSLNLSMRQKEAEANESSKKINEEVVKTELYFAESDIAKINHEIVSSLESVSHLTPYNSEL